MPTSVHVDELKINKLTEAQYDAAVQAGLIGENELSILTDAASGGQTIQYDTMPTASASNEGNIVQFVGTSDANYTNGYFYQCVSDGAVTPTYSWVAKEVQVAGDSLPSQAGNSGKFLTTNGTDASWSDKPLINISTGTNSYVIGSSTTPSTTQNANIVGISNNLLTQSSSTRGVGFGTNAYLMNPDCVAVGYNAIAGGSSGGIAIGSSAAAGHYWGVPSPIAIGYNASSEGSYSIALGGGSHVGNGISYAIQLGLGTNSENGTFCVGSRYNNANVNYKMMDADGTIPEARLADTTNAAQGQVLTLDSNNNAVWATPSASVSTVSGTLLSGSTAWGSGTDTQTLTVQGVTSSNTVIVSPTPLSSTDYADAGIICTAQSTNQLTFTCVTVPTNDIELSIVIIG